MTLADYINYFNKKHFRKILPDKWMVRACWVVLIIVLIIALTKFF
jgi:hypothetical protein